MDKEVGTKLHLDSFEAEQILEDSIMENVTMIVDGVSITVPAQAGAYIKTALDRRDSIISEKDSSLKELGGKVGTLEGEVKTLKETNDKLTTDSKDKPNIGALVAARMKLNESIKTLLPEDKLSAIDSNDADYETKVIDAALVANGVDISEGEKLYTDSTVLEAWKHGHFQQLVKAKATEAHNSLSGHIVGAGGDKKLTNDTKEFAYRKDVRERLKIAQAKRDGTYRETKTA
jgi:hypothetical protein